MCLLHFESEDITPGKRTRLRRDAVPSIFPPKLSQPKRKKPTNRREREIIVHQQEQFDDFRFLADDPEIKIE